MLISRRFDIPWEAGLFAGVRAAGARSTPAADAGEPPDVAAPVEVVRLDPCTPAAALADLRARGVRALLSEGGPTLFRGLLADGLVDELFLTLTPLLTGDDAETPILAGGRLDLPRGWRCTGCCAARTSCSCATRFRSRAAAPVQAAQRLACRRMQIEGVNALVAGGASGLGAATARALHAAGANVTIADLNAERGAALAEEIGARVRRRPTSPTPTQVEAAVAQAAGEDGLRISVCCAGHRLGREDRRAPRPARLRAVRDGHPRQPDRHVQRPAARGQRDARQRARRPGRARRVRQHRLDRRLRRPDRPDRLLRLQGRDRRPHAARRARPRAARHPRLRDRARACSTRRCWPACRRRRATRSARRSRSRRASAAPTSTPRSRGTSSRTRCSTAR